MSDTKLRPEDLTAEERAIVEDTVTEYCPHISSEAWPETYEWALQRIEARRAFFGQGESEKVECPKCKQKVGPGWDHEVSPQRFTCQRPQPAPPEPASTTNKSRGLYNKFNVERTDGKSEPGEKHYGCEYFVLDLTHDKFALPALRAYAEACGNEYPQLASDLLRKCPTPPEPAATVEIDKGFVKVQKSRPEVAR